MGIGPSSKETTLHHFRDPLVEYLTTGVTDLDLPGIVLQGTSDDNDHKQLVARRTGALVESMRVDGALVSIDSWGNTHIDFAAVIEAIGKRDIPVVGLSFVGNQASFVVTNPYMDTIIDYNKTTEGVENCVMGQNTAVELDAVKALAVLRGKIRKARPGMNFAAGPEIRLRRLIRRHYQIAGAREADGHSLRDKELLLNPRALERAAVEHLGPADRARVKAVAVRLLRPSDRDVRVNSILDFAPLAAKIKGSPGEGVTHVLDGFTVMLAAVEEEGFQPMNIGSADGILGEHVAFGRSGAPAPEDFILSVDVLLAKGEGRTREGIMAAHRACDAALQELRPLLAALSHNQADAVREHWDTARPGACRVALVKLISGLGCMYDTALFPEEPGGVIGARSIMELTNNMPLVISPNEYRDGAVHALC